MAAVTAKTLFVHNLPKDATNEQLADVFSEIGPIKRCHVVFDKETHKSTGKGYVTFAFDNDAENALKNTVKLGSNVLKLKFTSSKEQVAAVKYKKNAQNVKQNKKLKQAKKARVIIRNLSFKATEENLKQWISKFGTVNEVNIPKKNDGKMRGFAFITFDNMKTAVKTIKELNAAEFLNRRVAIDFALPKDKYNASKDSTVEINNDEGNSSEFTQNNETQSEEEVDPDGETVSIKSGSSREEDLAEEYSRPNIKAKHRKNRMKSNDVSEGKTVFVKNLSFDTTEDKLAETVKSFGEIDYCVINEDKESGHSRGTGFVKFKRKEDAEECIQQSNSEDSSLFVDGRQLQICLALSKSDVGKIKASQKTRVKDKRNLYLAKEGLIYPKSPAAKDVSQSDLAKRLNLEQRKRRLLLNVLYFVSTTRLSVHNLPEEIDDAALKRLFLKAVNDKTAVITEAKVMRHFIKSENKLGTSKGFGFVTFTEAKHALIALRRLNNNPDIFSKHKRPIIEFSIENKEAVNKKLKRNKKSKEVVESGTNNPCEEIEDEDFPFMGVKAKPLKENEKVTVPKLNRKIFEARKDLKERAKVVRNEQQVTKQEAQKKKIRKEKEKSRRDNNLLKSKEQVTDLDDFEQEFLRKRKNNVFEDEPKKKLKVTKKQKWYESVQ